MSLLHHTVLFYSNIFKCRISHLLLHVWVMSYVLSDAGTKHHDQKQLVKERVYLVYTPWSQSIIDNIQVQNSSRSRGKNHRGMMLLTGLHPPAGTQPAFLYSSGPTAQRWQLGVFRKSWCGNSGDLKMIRIFFFHYWKIHVNMNKLHMMAILGCQLDYIWN